MAKIFSGGDGSKRVEDSWCYRDTKKIPKASGVATPTLT